MLSTIDIKKLELISSDKSLENYFFINAKDPKWFYPLKEKGYFDPEKAPLPIESDQKGFFQLPDWHALIYLESLSKECKDEDIQKEILLIIINITSYHIKNKFILDNFRIWWYFIKILINIPPALQIIFFKSNNIDFGEDLLKHWLNSKFNTSLITHTLTEELLPKYFQADCFIFAEKIIKVLTTLKPEAPNNIETDFLKTKRVIRTLGDFHSLSKSLKANADKIGQLCSPDLLYNLANKLKGLFLKAVSESVREILIGENKLLIRVESERSNKMEKEFDFRITITKITDPKKDVLTTFDLNECRDKKTFLKAITDELLKLNISGVNKTNLEIEMSILYRNLYPDTNYSWYRSFEKDDAEDLYPAEGILIYALKALLFYKCKYDPNTGRNIIETLLSYNYQFSTFPRIALYIISNYRENYADLFWQIIRSDRDILYSYEYEYDVYSSLGKLVSIFTEEQKKLLDEIICETAKKHPFETGATDNPKLKQKWYKAMKLDPFFGPKYKEMTLFTGDREGEEPPESLFTLREGTGDSPLSPDKINQMGIDDIIKFLKEYRTKDSWKESEESLSDALRTAVQTNPNKFTHEIDKFLEIKYLYVNAVLWGLQESVKSGVELDWPAIFHFSTEYLSKPDFGKQPEPSLGSRHPEYHHKWVASSAADLVEVSLKNKEKGVAEKDLPVLEHLLDAIVKNVESIQYEADLKDPLTHALNTPLGKVAEAEIDLLFYRLHARKKDPSEHPPILKIDISRYQKLLDLKIPEAFTFLGRYLPNFNYLNSDWTTIKVKEYSKLEDKLWISFFHGYLCGDGVNNLLYHSLREQGYYSRGFATDLPERHGEQRFIQHIAIGYLRGFEKLDVPTSLIMTVLNNWIYEEISTIISLFWSFHQSLLIPDDPGVPPLAENNIMRGRILDLWKWFYDNDKSAKSKLGSAYAKHHSNLLRFTVYVEKITADKLRWLLLSAPYAEANFTSSFFLEDLNKYNDKEDIDKVGTIFIEMLKGCTPYYDKKDIEEIVLKLYKNDFKESANTICTEYGRRGDYFLRKIYEENNKREA